MRVDNNDEFTVSDGLTVVTNNGWVVKFYGSLFDVLMVNVIVFGSKPLSLLNAGISIPSGVDTLLLQKQQNGNIKLTESVTSG